MTGGLNIGRNYIMHQHIGPDWNKSEMRNVSGLLTWQNVDLHVSFYSTIHSWMSANHKIKLISSKQTWTWWKKSLASIKQDLDLKIGINCSFSKHSASRNESYEVFGRDTKNWYTVSRQTWLLKNLSANCLSPMQRTKFLLLTESWLSLDIKYEIFLIWMQNPIQLMKL